MNKTLWTMTCGLVFSSMAATALAQTMTTSKTQYTADSRQAQATQVRCVDCAQVIAVTVSNKKGEASAVGLIAGGVTGAILGHQVGGGLGKDLATVAGAAGGAYAGKRIEENVKTHKVWTVRVQYPDGRKRNFSFKQDPGFMTGDAVRNSRHTIVRG